ncbi:MAG: hypothetical protein V4793_46900, partial [Paraburkholderia tropica]
MAAANRWRRANHGAVSTLSRLLEQRHPIEPATARTVKARPVFPPLAMPPFAWRYDDDEVAQLAT